ncbi:MAG: FAD-dependent oxidoreductase [Solirubrobacterales bacterium]
MNPSSDNSYVQLRLPRPTSAWPFVRAFTVGLVVALAVSMFTAPELGSRVFWEVVVPLLPVTFLALPGLWRNICPMAATNQLPRKLSITRARPLPPWLSRHGYGIGLLLYFAVVSTRKIWLEDSSTGMAIMFIAALGVPFMTGLMFAGKSGYCGSICPLRPVQGLYGQSPIAHVENSHCKPCVGCTLNCSDLKPHTAHLDDLRNPDPLRAAYRKFLAGALPGFIVAFYTMPGLEQISVGGVYARFAVFMAASLGVFFVIDSFATKTVNVATALFAAISFVGFYWFNVPILLGAVADAFAVTIPEFIDWQGRVLLGLLGSIWLIRTWRKERDGVTASGRPITRPAAAATTPLPAVAPAPAPQQPAAEPARAAVPTALVPESAPSPDPTPATVAAEHPLAELAEAPTTADAVPIPMAGDPPVQVPDRRVGDRRAGLDEPSADENRRGTDRRGPRFTVTVLPERRQVEVLPGATLLEVAEAHELGLAPGCRMGLCGCDPIFILQGAASVSPAGMEEQDTLDRLDMPAHGRMACSTRVLGDVVVTLDPAAEPIPEDQPVMADASPLEPEPGPSLEPVPAAESNGHEPELEITREDVERIVEATEEPVVPAPVSSSNGNGATPEPPAPNAEPTVVGLLPRTGSGRETARVVIIGNGIAGVTAADHVRRQDAECEIHLITDERHPFYNRTGVSKLITADGGIAKMYLLSDRWYQQRKIISWLNTNVSEIDRQTRRVVLSSGEWMEYDRLIIATGASPFVPPIEGSDLPGTFVVRDADDALEIRSFVEHPDCRRVVVAGGGVLGLEAADTLAQLGVTVTVVERSDWVSPRQLDERAGMAVQRELEHRGIEVRTGRTVRSIEGDEKVALVTLDDGTVLPAEAVVICAGVVPNRELAEEAGLEVNHGIVVGDDMRTSDPLIFAAGDVAEHAGNIYGLWAPGVLQGEIAAVNAVGGSRSFQGAPIAIHIKVADLPLSSVGKPETEAGDEEIAIQDLAEGRYRKLVVTDGHVTGAVLLRNPQEISVVTNAVREHRDVRGLLDDLRAGDWSVLNEASFEAAAAAPSIDV